MNEAILMPHEILANAREAACITVEQVAADLNLTAYVVRAIESGRYDNLYGDAFVCGVIRSYAGLLGLDPLPLVMSYRASREKDVISAESEATAPSLLDQHKQFRTGYGIAAALVLVIMIGMFAQRESVSESRPADTTIAIDTIVGTTVVNSIEDMPVENPTQDILPELVVQPPAEAPLAESVEQSGQQLPVNDGLSSLNFVFSADCWVEVFDGDNRKIFSSLQRAQQRLELSGKPPFRITLGYAPGVVLTYNSELVPIDVDGAHMAKLVLGNS